MEPITWQAGLAYAAGQKQKVYFLQHISFCSPTLIFSESGPTINWSFAGHSPGLGKLKAQGMLILLPEQLEEKLLLTHAGAASASPGTRAGCEWWKRIRELLPSAGNPVLLSLQRPLDVPAISCF